MLSQLGGVARVGVEVQQLAGVDALAGEQHEVAAVPLELGLACGRRRARLPIRRGPLVRPAPLARGEAGYLAAAALRLCRFSGGSA